MLSTDYASAESDRPAAPIRLAGGKTIFEGVAARAHAPGDGLRYANHVEYRTVEEVRRIVRMINSHKGGLPLVLLHPIPNQTGSEIGAVDHKTTIVGRVLSARLVHDEAVVRIQVDDAHALKVIERGFRELSLGYGSRRDANNYQTVFLVDHLAIVGTGRCGGACAIRTDCAEPEPAEDACPCRHADHVPNKEQATTMPTPKNPTNAEALRSLESQRAEMETRATSAEALAASEKLRADNAEGQNIELAKVIEDLRAELAAGSDAAESDAIKREALRADEAERTIARFNETFEERVRARAAIERKAAIVMGPEFKMDGLSDREIQASVVKHLDPNADTSKDVADGVISGRFAAVTDGHAASARQLGRVAQISAPALHADAAKPAKKPAWQTPLPNDPRNRK